MLFEFFSCMKLSYMFGTNDYRNKIILSISAEARTKRYLFWKLIKYIFHSKLISLRALMYFTTILNIVKDFELRIGIKLLINSNKKLIKTDFMFEIGIFLVKYQINQFCNVDKSYVICQKFLIFLWTVFSIFTISLLFPFAFLRSKYCYIY